MYLMYICYLNVSFYCKVLQCFYQHDDDNNNNNNNNNNSNNSNNDNNNNNCFLNLF